MLTGALLLLGFYLVEPVTGSRPPQWLLFVVNFIGYGVISVGFVLAMRARREAEELKKEKASLLPATQEEPQYGAGEKQHRSEGDEGDAPVVGRGFTTGVDTGSGASSDKE